MRRFETLQGATVPVHIVHKRFARAVHISMYLCLIMLPVTGLMIAGLSSQGYTDATPDESQTVMDVVLDLHGAAADLSYFLIILHISAAVYSRIKGEGVWSSMVPVLNNEKPTENELIKKIYSSAIEEGRSHETTIEGRQLFEYNYTNVNSEK